MEDDVKEPKDPFEIELPMPEHVDPAMCRDEFLRTFVQQQEKRISSLRPRSTIFDLPEEMPKMSVTETVYTTGEAMVVHHIAKQRKKSSVLSREEHIANIKLHTEALMQLNRDCQKASVDFVLVRLLKQLRLFSSPWPGKISDMPYNLFSWSLEHFMYRLDVNQLYLDVIPRERTKEDLDCLKFRSDLNEIILFIYDIKEQFRDGEDLCTGVCQSLREAKYVLDAPWVDSLERNMRTKTLMPRLSNAELFFEKSQMQNQHFAFMERFEDAAALDPIELRYQVNWYKSIADQRIFRLEGRERDLTKELKDVQEKTVMDAAVQHYSEVMYSYQVDALKRQITEWQTRYDIDLESAEVQCHVTRLGLQKLREDLAFYQEQKEMFITRIAEVRALIAEEEVSND
ncbi:hypothetical protein KR009_009172 [Drosophila setifemur]|nr:hypothetical protein KR009_009172 [Drosophila setifemur]